MAGIIPPPSSPWRRGWCRCTALRQEEKRYADERAASEADELSFREVEQHLGFTLVKSFRTVAGHCVLPPLWELNGAVYFVAPYIPASGETVFGQIARYEVIARQLRCNFSRIISGFLLCSAAGSKTPDEHLQSGASASLSLQASKLYICGSSVAHAPKQRRCPFFCFTPCESISFS